MSASGYLGWALSTGPPSGLFGPGYFTVPSGLFGLGTLQVIFQPSHRVIFQPSHPPGAPSGQAPGYLGLAIVASGLFGQGAIQPGSLGVLWGSVAAATQ